MVRKSRLLFLIGVSLLVCFGLLLVCFDRGVVGRSDGDVLFRELRESLVSEVVLEGTGKKVELTRKSGGWKVSSRWGFRADAAKVRSLLFLKIPGIRLLSSVDASSNKRDTVGENGDSPPHEILHIRYLDAEGREVASARFYDIDGSANSATDDFRVRMVKRPWDERPRLLDEPLSLSLAPTDWIDANVCNVHPADVLRVVEEKLENGAGKTIFQLSRDEGGQGGVSVRPNRNDGRKLDQTVISQIFAGLSNFRIVDVLRADDAVDRGVGFDRLTRLTTSDDLVFSVYTGKHDEHYYARLSIDEDTIGLDPEGDDTSRRNGSSSTREKVARLTERFGPWVYVIDKYMAQRFRRTREELFKRTLSASPRQRRF